MKSPNQTKGKLLLIPNLISETSEFLSSEITETIRQTRYYLAETPKTARRFIKWAVADISFESLDIKTYNKATKAEELENLMQPLRDGFDVGIITDAGMPGIADPGNLAVNLAHQWGIKVKPLIGASSVFLALAASGLPGQHFSFHGYLPVKPHECISRLKSLEWESSRKNISQIFIETPYRNEKLFKLILKTLRPDTQLCIGYDITGKKENIMTKTIRNWFRETALPEKLPCVFIIYSGK